MGETAGDGDRAEDSKGEGDYGTLSGAGIECDGFLCRLFEEYRGRFWGVVEGAHGSDGGWRCREEGRGGARGSGVEF